MMKSIQKKGQNYIPFLQSTYPEMQRKTSSGGQGAPAAHQSGTCVPSPRWAGGLQPHARAARDPGPQWAGGTPAACQNIQAKMTKSSQKRVKIIYLFCNLHTLKCKEKHPLARPAHTPLVNQSSSGWLLVHD